MAGKGAKFLRGLFSPNQDLSLADLALGVNAVHTAVGRLPGAQRIDPSFRAAQVGMLPTDVVEQYNNAKRFGTTARGEPLRAHYVDQLTRAKVGPQDEMPDRFSLYLRPESMGGIDPAYMSSNPGLHFSGVGDLWGQSGNYPMSLGMMRRLERDAPRGAPKPRAYSINAMGTRPDSVAPGEYPWWREVPNKGQDLYALGYDVLRAAGQGNVSNSLTDVNKVRRLYNVGAYRMGHGNFAGIAPLEEPIGQLFRHPVSDTGAEREYLENLFGMKSNDPAKFKRGAGLYDSAVDLNEVQLARGYGKDPISAQLSDDELAGLLWMREAQMAGAYGPKNSAGQVGGLRLGDYRPDDTAELRNLASPFQDQLRALGSRFRPSNAISANAMGRQITTEATIKRMLRGEEPEAIAADIIGGAPETAFTGRYRSGGLVAAMM